jgi:hypothetical protein
MTLKELKSRVKIEIQDLNPGRQLPGLEREIKSAGNKLVRAFGGFEATATFSTIVGQQEYSSADDGFPSDILAVENCWKNTSTSDKQQLDVILRDEVTTITNGEPFKYYWESNKLGFDRIPSSVVSIILDYYALADTPASETATYLARLGAAEDDVVWNAIIFEVAAVYFRRKAIQDAKQRTFWMGFAAKYSQEAGKERFFFGQDWGVRNRDKSHKIRSESPLFGNRTDSLIQRVAGDGDLVRVYK